MALPDPYYEDDAVTIYHGDCRDVLSRFATNGVQFDSIVTDPPYGMNWDTDSRRFSGGEPGRGRSKDWGGGVAGDTGPFDPTHILGFERVVIFGANHFAQRLPVGTTLVWTKRRPESFGSFLSDAEIAWMKGGHGVYCFEDLSGNGAGANYPKFHPTQKTEKVMAWCIEKCGTPEGGTVLDPYMGSGTTLRAAKDLGRKAIGIEIEEKYCEIAAKRMAQEVLTFE